MREEVSVEVHDACNSGQRCYGEQYDFPDIDKLLILVFHHGSALLARRRVQACRHLIYVFALPALSMLAT